MGREQLRLRLRFVERADLPDTEDLWAEPVDAHDGGGIYRLLNTSFVVPLGAGDIVRAAIDGRGRLQIVDIVRPSDRVLTVTGHEDSVSTEEAQQVAQGWTEGTDGWTESNDNVLYTVWPEGVPVDKIAGALQRSIGDRADWHLYATALPADRVRQRHEEILFELDTDTPPVFETAYWAPDDQAWADRGVTDPETLAAIQTLAGEDAQVAAALLNGKHDRVLAYIRRMSAEDPRSLPPLEGTLHDEV
jgi:hypothetical protein